MERGRRLLCGITLLGIMSVRHIKVLTNILDPRFLIHGGAVINPGDKKVKS